MSPTKIEWTDESWNPVTGCDRVSPGCDHCYALTLAPRLKAMGNPSYQTDGTRKTSGPGFGVALHPEMLDKPLRWKRPRRVFVNSMSDLFHPDVPDDFIADVFAVMMLASQHTFQVLTKRPRRMAHLLGDDSWPDFVRDRAIDALANDPGADRPILAMSAIPNVWLGVSVENQEWADKRIPLLLETPAAVRFLSCEPLLGPIDLSAWEWCDMATNQSRLAPTFCRKYQGHDGDCDYQAGRQMADWVIVGGESGKDARPIHPDWALSIRDQCVDSGTPFFFKQWGRWVPRDEDHDGLELRGLWLYEDGRTTHGALSDGSERAAAMFPVGKKRAGRELDGRTWDEMPSMERVG